MNWNLADGADVLRHILAELAVTPCGSLHQHAMHIAQAHRQAVELGLGHVLDGRRRHVQAELAAHAGVEGFGAAGFGVGLGADAEHRHGMAHAGEGVERSAADALCRRIGCHQFRVRRLDRLQLLEQTVVFGVRDQRIVEHVVAVGVLVQGASELLDRRGVGRRSGGGSKQIRRHGAIRRMSKPAQENSRRAAAEPAERSRWSSVS